VSSLYPCADSLISKAISLLYVFLLFNKAHTTSIFYTHYIVTMFYLAIFQNVIYLYIYTV